VRIPKVFDAPESGLYRYAWNWPIATYCAGRSRGKADMAYVVAGFMGKQRYPALAAHAAACEALPVFREIAQQLIPPGG